MNQERLSGRKGYCVYLETNTNVRLNSKNPTAVDSQTSATTSGKFKEDHLKGKRLSKKQKKDFM